jgi:hypothetical protein
MNWGARGMAPRFLIDEPTSSVSVSPDTNRVTWSYDRLVSSSLDGSDKPFGIVVPVLIRIEYLT